MAIYDRQIKIALKKIKQKGMKATWFEIKNETDSNRPYLESDVVKIPHIVDIVIFPKIAESLVEAVIGRIKDIEVPSGTLICYMGAVDFTPSYKDELLTVNNELLRVVKFNIIAPNGRPILYIVEFE